MKVLLVDRDVGQANPIRSADLQLSRWRRTSLLSTVKAKRQNRPSDGGTAAVRTDRDNRELEGELQSHENRIAIALVAANALWHGEKRPLRFGIAPDARLPRMTVDRGENRCTPPFARDLRGEFIGHRREVPTAGPRILEELCDEAAAVRLWHRTITMPAHRS